MKQSEGTNEYVDRFVPRECLKKPNVNELVGNTSEAYRPTARDETKIVIFLLEKLVFSRFRSKRSKLKLQNKDLFGYFPLILY